MYRFFLVLGIILTVILLLSERDQPVQSGPEYEAAVTSAPAHRLRAFGGLIALSVIGLGFAALAMRFKKPYMGQEPADLSNEAEVQADEVEDEPAPVEQPVGIGVRWDGYL